MFGRSLITIFRLQYLYKKLGKLNFRRYIFRGVLNRYQKNDWWWSRGHTIIGSPASGRQSGEFDLYKNITVYTNR